MKDNKGFAITGIIYTLFIIFLLILVTVISGLGSFRKMMINSTEIYENTFQGNKIGKDEILTINSTGTVPYSGKYYFQVTNTDGITNNNCTAYLAKNTNFKDKLITFSPSECNINISKIELFDIYSFEGEE